MRVYENQVTITEQGHVMITEASALALPVGKFPTEIVYGQRTYSAPRRIENTYGDLEAMTYTAKDPAYVFTILND